MSISDTQNKQNSAEKQHVLQSQRWSQINDEDEFAVSRTTTICRTVFPGTKPKQGPTGTGGVVRTSKQGCLES
jgi:hypothetical protein